MTTKQDTTISVIVACYNYPDRLQACLQSLHLQILAPHQIVVSDDGSDDPKVQDLAAMAGATFVTHDRLLNSEGRGIRQTALTLNQGVEAATGTIIVTLQQDHIIAPDYLLWVARSLTPGEIMFGLTDNLPFERYSPQFLVSGARATHLPDSHHRYQRYLYDGRRCLVEFHDWRDADGLDSAQYRSSWQPCDTTFTQKSHHWMDHMLQSQLVGHRFVINPLMRLWHITHEARVEADGEEAEWVAALKESEKYMIAKWGKLVWQGYLASPHHDESLRRMALWDYMDELAAQAREGAQ